MTERLHFHFSLSCIGEGNGNPLQCSCLENPRDGGAWWTAVYGVTQSRTRLKGLSIAGWPQASWCTIGLQWGPRHAGSNGSWPPGCPPTAGPHRCPGHSPARPPRPPGTARPPRLSSPSGAETGRTDEHPARASWGSEGGAGTGWGRTTDRKGDDRSGVGGAPGRRSGAHPGQSQADGARATAHIQHRAACVQLGPVLDERVEHLGCSSVHLCADRAVRVALRLTPSPLPCLRLPGHPRAPPSLLAQEHSSVSAAAPCFLPSASPSGPAAAGTADPASGPGLPPDTLLHGHHPLALLSPDSGHLKEGVGGDAEGQPQHVLTDASVPGHMLQRQALLAGGLSVGTRQRSFTALTWTPAPAILTTDRCPSSTK